MGHATLFGVFVHVLIWAALMLPDRHWWSTPIADHKERWQKSYPL